MSQPIEMRPGARIKLMDQGVELLNCVGEVRWYSLERGPDGVKVTLHMPEPMPLDKSPPPHRD